MKNLPQPNPPYQPNLALDLARAEAIKRHMTQLLRELEAQATGRPVDKPGTWRHHPKEWAEQNPRHKTSI